MKLGLLRDTSALRKVVLGIAVLILGTIAAVAVYYPQQVYSEFYRRLEAETVVAASLLGSELAPAVEFNDEKNVRKMVQHARAFPDVLYVGVTDRAGRLLIEVGRRTAAGPRPQGLARLRVQRLGDRLMVQNVIRGVEGDVVGYLELESTLARLREKRVEQIRGLVLIGSIVLLLGLLLSVGLYRALIQPIVMITHGVLRVARGDLRAPDVLVTSHDEIGQLAEAFNRMKAALLNTTVSKDYLDNLLASLADMLLVVNKEGRVLSANRAAMQTLKLSSAMLIGCPLARLVQDDTSVARHLEPLLSAGSMGGLEMVFVTSDGQPVPTTVNASLIRTGGEEEEAIALVARDMRQTLRLLTAAAEAEAVRRKSNELSQAYRQLADAHRELQETQAHLVQSGKLAAVGQLAAGLAHEINNPLSAVLTYAVMAQRKLEVHAEVAPQALGEVQRALGLIKTGAERCKAISDNLLAFSRQSDETRRPVRLAQAIRSTLDLIGASLTRSGAVLRLRVPDDIIVLGNENELQQVVLNLAVNASQAMPEGGEIDVTAVEVEGAVRLEISDTGEGIEPQHLGHIFEPFFTTKPVGKGTGLGLFIVHGIISKLGGEIAVESTRGQGTRFIIRLPAARSRPGC